MPVTAMHAVLAYIALSRYTIGAALEQQTARDGPEIVLPLEGGNEGAAHLARLAREVVTLGPEHEFEMGLTVLIDGLEHRLHRNDAGPAHRT